jgi:hypothetical protein
MVALRRASVAGVLITPKSSELLTAKERARLSVVRSKIESGEPLFTKEDLDAAGKTTIGQRVSERVVREDTDAEIMAKVAYWRSGAGKRDLKVQTTGVELVDEIDNFNEVLGIAPAELGENAPQYQVRKYKNGEKHTTHFLYCSFCGKRVEDSLATKEKGSKRIACPEHCLKIRNVKFEETVG